MLGIIKYCEYYSEHVCVCYIQCSKNVLYIIISFYIHLVRINMHIFISGFSWVYFFLLLVYRYKKTLTETP